MMNFPRLTLTGFLLTVAALSPAYSAPAFAQEESPSAPAESSAEGDANAAQQKAQDPKEVVAEVNGTKVTRGDVLESATDLPPQIRSQIDVIFPQLLDRYIGLTLIEAEARKQNLAEDPDVKAKVKQAEEMAIRQTYVAHLLKERVTEAAIKAAYDEKVKQLADAEEVKARHILLATEDQAKAVIADLKNGADFADLAKEKSIDKASGANGGDLGWFTKDIMVKEFSEAAFAMKPGEVSNSPVKSQFGWHVIKLEDRRKKQVPTFEEMHSEIETSLSEEAIQNVVNELRKAAAVKVLVKSAPAP